MSTHASNAISFQDLNLDPAIFKAIHACGYTNPTPVQAQSIPTTLSGKDIVACAQTGSGKTAAFVLPALHRLSQQPASKKTRILILTPTRELATQITKAAAQYGKFLRFQIVSLVGGMPYGGQIKDLARGADIIVATPGRLLDHIQAGRVDLSDVEMLVLDEADRMLDMGFIDDVQYIAKLTPSKRQTLLFSATLDKQLSNVISTILKNPVRIDLSQETKSKPQIQQEFYKAQGPQQKWRLLKHFLQDKNIFKAIIFSATKINADKLAAQLSQDGFPAAALHGDLRQNVRNRTVDQLRRGKIQFLVATDVAARGIDIPDITHVINYDLPRFSEDYVHRIGRTGRAGKSGIAISFASPADMRHLQSIERYLGKRITLRSPDAALNSSDASESPKHEFVSDQPKMKSARTESSFKRRSIESSQDDRRATNRSARPHSKSKFDQRKSPDRKSQSDDTRWSSDKRKKKDNDTWSNDRSNKKTDSNWSSEKRKRNDDTNRSFDRSSKKSDSNWSSEKRKRKDDTHWSSDRNSKNTDSNWSSEKRKRKDDTHWSPDRSSKKSESYWAAGARKKKDDAGKSFDKPKSKSETYWSADKESKVNVSYASTKPKRSAKPFKKDGDNHFRSAKPGKGRFNASSKKRTHSRSN